MREICEDFKVGYRWQAVALDCLQEAAEAFLVEEFESTYLSILLVLTLTDCGGSVAATRYSRKARYYIRQGHSDG